MSSYTVLGVRQFTYKRKSDGVLTNAIEIHCSYPAPARDGEVRAGDFVERLFVPASRVSVIPRVDDRISVIYNRYGGVDGITFVE